MGVLQGSILFYCLLYVDFQICYRSSNMNIIKRQLHLFLDKLLQWAVDDSVYAWSYTQQPGS